MAPPDAIDPTETWAAQDFCSAKALFVPSLKRDIILHCMNDPESEGHMASHIERRKFLATLGGAAATWPLAARAEQPAMPVIAFINARRPLLPRHYAPALRNGLNETGYIEGQNVTVEYHWLDGQYNRLPALVADLVRRQVAVIAPTGNLPSAGRQSCNRDDPDRLRRLGRPGQAWPCRQPRAAGRQRDRHQFFSHRGGGEATGAAA